MQRSNFDPEAELAFVDRCLRGDRDSLEQLASRIAFLPRMLAMRNARSGRPLDDDELHDVVQTTYVVVLDRLGQYRPIAPLESWVQGIGLLQFKDAVRSKWRERDRRRELDDDVAEELPVPDPLSMSFDLETLFKEMGDMEARIVRLKCIEGLTFAEIGLRLRISTNTAKTMYYRGLARARRSQGGDGLAGGPVPSDDQ